MAGYPFAGIALKGLEPYAGKLARTVLRGRKLPGGHIRLEPIFQMSKQIHIIIFLFEYQLNFRLTSKKVI